MNLRYEYGVCCSGRSARRFVGYGVVGDEPQGSLLDVEQLERFLDPKRKEKLDRLRKAGKLTTIHHLDRTGKADFFGQAPPSAPAPA